VEIGIDSMSLNPDTVLKTTEQVLELEKRSGIVSTAGGSTG
jgi:pyruvate,water dikinase